MLWRMKLSDSSDNGKNAAEIAEACKLIESGDETIAIIRVNPKTMLALLGFSVVKAHAVGGELFSQYMGYPIKELSSIEDDVVELVSFDNQFFNQLPGGENAN